MLMPQSPSQTLITHDIYHECDEGDFCNPLSPIKKEDKASFTLDKVTLMYYFQVARILMEFDLFSTQFQHSLR